MPLRSSHTYQLVVINDWEIWQVVNSFEGGFYGPPNVSRSRFLLWSVGNKDYAVNLV